MRLELTTPSLRVKCSTAELIRPSRALCPFPSLSGLQISAKYFFLARNRRKISHFLLSSRKTNPQMAAFILLSCAFGAAARFVGCRLEQPVGVVSCQAAHVVPVAGQKRCCVAVSRCRFPNTSSPVSERGVHADRIPVGRLRTCRQVRHLVSTILKFRRDDAQSLS